MYLWLRSVDHCGKGSNLSEKAGAVRSKSSGARRELFRQGMFRDWGRNQSHASLRIAQSGLNSF